MKYTIFLAGLLAGFACFAQDKTIHVIPHSHWDREWYMPFEQHRMRLVHLLDQVLQRFDEDPEFTYFMMDGQTILFEDYLEIRPENRARLGEAIRSGKLSFGPQYILPDTFLADGECQIRNHLLAFEDAGEWGNPSDFFLMMGYFPDTFGNTAQSPQILNGFDIHYAMVGRGFAADQTGSEFHWQAPSGASVFTHNFSDWYCNGVDLTNDPQKLWSRLNRSAQFATSPQLLLMNGCDHQPLQPDLTQVMAALRTGLVGTSLKMSDPMHFLQAVQQSGGPWKTFYGEARYQDRTGGLGLEDVYSARLYLKQANFAACNLLEHYAEPLAALASLYSDYDYPQAFLRHAWRTLLQNQVHDDICGCSVDAVHQDMMVRFRRVHEICEPIARDALKSLAQKINLSALQPGQRALIVFNPTPYPRSEVITSQVDFADGTPVAALSIQDPFGRMVQARLLSAARTFTYELPNDRFRVPYHVIRATFIAQVDAPPLGYAVYTVAPASHATEPVAGTGVMAGANFIENEHLRLQIHADGRFDLFEKKGRHTFTGLGALELASDRGDEYNFRRLAGEKPFLLTGPADSLQVVQNDGLVARIACARKISWPQSLDSDKKSRSGQGYLKITTLFTLRKSSPFVEIDIQMDNRLKDYRLRWLLPSGIHSDHLYSEDDFYIAPRPVKPVQGYNRDSYSLPQGIFSWITDTKTGLMVGNKGMTEIEPKIEPDGSVSLELTLLRCVGELGDWGYFPTEDSQCQGYQTAAFCLLPMQGDPLQTGAYRQVLHYVQPLFTVDSDAQNGTWPLQQSLVQNWPQDMILTALKKAENRSSLVLRGYNPIEASLAATPSALDMIKMHDINLREIRQPGRSDAWVRAFEIHSWEFEIENR